MGMDAGSRSRVGDYAPGMCVDGEAVRSGERREGDARGLGLANGKLRRRGDRNHYRDAGQCSLLDHLIRATAGDHAKASLGIEPGGNHRADELVESVMPPDILAYCEQAAVG